MGENLQTPAAGAGIDPKEREKLDADRAKLEQERSAQRESFARREVSLLQKSGRIKPSENPDSIVEMAMAFDPEKTFEVKGGDGKIVKQTAVERFFGDYWSRDPGIGTVQAGSTAPGTGGDQGPTDPQDKILFAAKGVLKERGWPESMLPQAAQVAFCQMREQGDKSYEEYVEKRPNGASVTDRSDRVSFESTR